MFLKILGISFVYVESYIPVLRYDHFDLLANSLFISVSLILCSYNMVTKRVGDLSS